jgi:hypothetical protein
MFGIGTGIALAQTATTTTSYTGSNQATSTTATIQIMTHLCGNNVRNLSDFQALSTSTDPIAAFLEAELNCPTTGLLGNEAATGTIASPRMAYDFTVLGNGTTTSQRLASSTLFMQHAISETDLGRDINHDGMISSSTALDISHYEFMPVFTDNGRIMVTETNAPSGFMFGTVRFTPNELVANNDMDAFVGLDASNARIDLDVSRDQNRTVMLHIYNFLTASTTATSTTSTGSTATSTSSSSGTVTGNVGTTTPSTGGNGNTGNNRGILRPLSPLPPLPVLLPFEGNTSGTDNMVPISQRIDAVQTRINTVFDHIEHMLGR